MTGMIRNIEYVGSLNTHQGNRPLGADPSYFLTSRERLVIHEILSLAYEMITGLRNSYPVH